MDYRLRRERKLERELKVMTVLTIALMIAISGMGAYIYEKGRQTHLILEGLNPSMTRNVVEFRLTPDKIIEDNDGETMVAAGKWTRWEESNTRKITVYVTPQVAETICHELFHNIWDDLPEEEKLEYERYGAHLNTTGAEAHSRLNQDNLKKCFLG